MLLRHHKLRCGSPEGIWLSERRPRPHFGIEQPVALVFSYKANVTDSNKT